MIRNKIIILLSISCLFSHEIDAPAKWKQYYRGSYIINENDDYGFGGYFRLKRTTQYTFRDFRSYLHFIKGDSYKKIRYKSSNKFIEFDRLYSYSTISIDQNSKVGVNVRYHGNQGIGLFIKESTNNHINAELALAYDVSDYLNDSRKTSYIKSGLYWDQKINNHEIKLELEHYYQITDLINNVDLSRLELLFEFYFSLNDDLQLILGYELEQFEASDNNLNSSAFLSIGYKDAFNIQKFKNCFLK